jgi:cytochrome c oxidase accessory protein FixG
MNNPRELPTDHLATTTKDGHRVYLYTADVRGWFRTFRNILNVVLIAVFLTLPWMRIGGRPAILLNVPERKFAILGIQFWAHDAPMLFFVIAGAVLAIFFITAVWGRIWCGYACPQTVFVDGVFRKIERLIEGDSITRKRLDASPWTSDKLFKKTTKWAVFVVVSLVLGHSFLAYFTGTEALAEMMQQSPIQNPGAFGVMAFISGLVLFDFGWFREQFCVIACPYGRFQSVLMDDRSMVVGYDVDRGEPRRGVATSNEATGDCVNCYRCVAVCPTGIDIRRGTQMECIACTACMDACDRVMDKVGKPTGLIRYTTFAGNKDQVSPFRARSMIYAVLIAIVATSLVVKIRNHKLVSADFVRATELPYQVVTNTDGSATVTNHFKLDVRNQDFDPSMIRLRLAAESQALGVELVTINPEVQLQAGELRRLDVFFRFPKSIIEKGRAEAWVEIEGKDQLRQEVRLVGPLF